MKKTIAALGSIRVSYPLVLLIVVCGLGVGMAVFPRIVDALTMNRVQIDGGGGGGEIRNVPKTQIVPEIVPSSAASATNITIATPKASPVSGAYIQTIQVPGTLWYAWNRWIGDTDTSIEGYSSALSQPSITIGYDVGVYDASTGAKIAPSGAVVVGQKVNLTFGPYVSSNIYWFGTGYSMDSPYGEWRANATAPDRVNGSVTCMSKDFLLSFNLVSYNLNFDVYIPFVVNPPARSVSNTSGLSCDTGVTGADGSYTIPCTVTASGSLNPTFNFDSTYGKFYYRYWDYRPSSADTGYTPAGCYGNNIPMTDAYGLATGPTYNNYTTIYPGYQVAVPAAAITYPITSSNSYNTPPSAPTVSGPTTGDDAPTSSYTFSFSSIDPNGDDIRYGVDWNNDGTVDEWVPASGYASNGGSGSVAAVAGYVSSGSTQSVAHGWNSQGAKPFQVLAQNSHGATSLWTSALITISEPPAAPRPTLTNSSPIVAGSAAVLTWTCGGNVTSASIQGIGSVSPATGGSVSTGVLTASTSYTLTCTGPGGSLTDSTYVTVIPPTPSASSVTIQCSPSVVISSPVWGQLNPPSQQIIKGKQAVLTWTSGNGATSCTGIGFDTGGAASGTAIVSPSSTQSYGLTCTDGVTTSPGSTSLVKVTDAILSLTPSTQIVRAGNWITLRWSAVGGLDLCSISGPWSLANAGTQGTSPSIQINNESTFTLSCIADTLTLSTSTTVKLIPSYHEF